MAGVRRAAPRARRKAVGIVISRGRPPCGTAIGAVAATIADHRGATTTAVILGVSST